MQLKQLILQKIAELGEALLDGFFPAKYSEARLWRGLLKVDSSHKFSKPTFSVILSQLRKEGFIARMNSRKKAKWRITPKGLEYLRRARISAKNYEDGIMRIVSFDIPEKYRKKRRWIREELFGLGYHPLQKSVWVGFSPLPENFFEDLDLLSLKEHIHIFSVGKKGTIMEVMNKSKV